MPPKLVTVAVKPGAVVRKDGRSYGFRLDAEIVCTVAEAASYYLSGAAWLPDDREDAQRVRTVVEERLADAERPASPRVEPGTVEDPHDFGRPSNRVPLAAVESSIPTPPPVLSQTVRS